MWLEWRRGCGDNRARDAFAEDCSQPQVSGSQTAHQAQAADSSAPLPGPQTKAPSIERRDASREQPSPSAVRSDHMARALRCDWLRWATVERNGSVKTAQST